MDATDTLIDTFQMASLNLAIWMIARDLAQDICQKYECNVPDSAKEPSQYYHLIPKNRFGELTTNGFSSHFKKELEENIAIGW